MTRRFSFLASQAVQRFVTRVVPALQQSGKVDVILMLRESDNFLTEMTLDVRFVLTPVAPDPSEVQRKKSKKRRSSRKRTASEYSQGSLGQVEDVND